MKKTLAFALALIMTLSLAACGQTDDSKKKKSDSSDSSSVTDSSSDESEEETTTTTTTAETTTTTTTTPETTTTADTEPAKEYSIAGIVGDWYIDGDPAAAHISVHEDGTFESFLASGTLEYTGTVTAGVYDLGALGGEGEYFSFTSDDKGEISVAFFVPYSDAEVVEFTSVGNVSQHFLPAQEKFDMPEGMPYDYSCPLNKTNGVDLHISQDGRLEGLFVGYDLNDKNERVVIYSHFAGFLGSLNDEGSGVYSMEITNISTVKGLPNQLSNFYNYVSEEDSMDVSDVYGSIGLFKGEKLYLYPQGTKFDDLPEELTKRIKEQEEKSDKISDIYLYAENAGLAFRSA